MDRRPSRVSSRQLSGHFEPTVVEAVRQLAREQKVTHQIILAKALNDLFEKNGLKRLASERALPRGRAVERESLPNPHSTD